MYGIEFQSKRTARLYPEGEPQGYASVHDNETWVYATADASSARLSQYTYGEPLRIYRKEGDYYLAQSLRDHYSGWIKVDAIENSHNIPTFTHITIAITPVTTGADLKSTYQMTLPADACLTPIAESGDYLQLPTDGWVHKRHLAKVDDYADIIATARGQIGRSYVWGGRGIAGLDCSALVQWSYRRAGYNIPRDSDLQEFYLQEHHKRVDISELARGDLLFLSGHVMLANDAYTVIHASGYHMQVVVEDLADALQRYKKSMGSNYRLRVYRWHEEVPFVHVFD
ncbi:MAG: NlpC/P60 family protein [Cardiobacteriaceae bacterium]|nr:NlpC/P60 family protein [Cardiobacteriaceae bacterium]